MRNIEYYNIYAFCKYRDSLVICLNRSNGL